MSTNTTQHTYTLTGLKHTLDELYSHVSKLEELNESPAINSRMPPLSPNSVEKLKTLRVATEEGKSIPKLCFATRQVEWFYLSAQVEPATVAKVKGSGRPWSRANAPKTALAPQAAD